MSSGVRIQFGELELHLELSQGRLCCDGQDVADELTAVTLVGQVLDLRTAISWSTAS